MDQSFTRGAAVAAFTLGTLAAFGSARAQVSAGAIRPARGDSVFVRVIGTDQKVLIDSVMVIMRALDGEAPMSEQAFRLRRELDALTHSLAMGGRGRGVNGSITLRAAPSSEVLRELESRRIKGWIGISTGRAPHEEIGDSTGYFVRYFKYPEIISVEANSPAQRAGIIPGDVLVAYDGNDVVNRRIDVGQMLVPDRRLSVTVQREGESKEFSMVVAKAPMRITFRRNDEPVELIPFPPEMRGGQGGAWVRGMPVPARPDQPERIDVVRAAGAQGGDVRVGTSFMFSSNGVLGAVLLTVTPEFARATKLKEGVVIQECPEDSPAYRSGLRTGDAIVSVSGQAVSRTTDVRTMLFSKRNERTAVFQVLRDKKPVTVNVKW